MTLLPKYAAAQILRIKQALDVCEAQAKRDGSAYMQEGLATLHDELTQGLEMLSERFGLPVSIQPLSGGVDKPSQP